LKRNNKKERGEKKSKETVKKKGENEKRRKTEKKIERKETEEWIRTKQSLNRDTMTDFNSMLIERSSDKKKASNSITK